MKLIITGFANSGKTTVFNALTGLTLATTAYPTAIATETEPHVGVVKIPDTRVDTLASIFRPKKITYATVEYIDYLGITSASAGGDSTLNVKVFNVIKDADALIHVVRVFSDEAIVHPLSSVDPLRDISSFEDERILGDLDLVEKRLSNIEEQARRGKKPNEADRQIMLKCKKYLEDEIVLSDVQFSEEEKRLLLPYQFLTTMAEIILLNIDESDMSSDHILTLQNSVVQYFQKKGQETVPAIVVICGKIEMELAQLHPDESRVFLEDLRIAEPARHKLCRISYDALGLISFLTIIKDEVRAWTVKRGTSALQAAGKIHSDIERGFIRAETVHYDDFISAGKNMAAAKEKGLTRLEGKAYIVQDGDIINFKFNV